MKYSLPEIDSVRLGQSRYEKSGWDRTYHEERARELMRSARGNLRSVRGCTPGTVYAAVKANRDIAHARTHLASIGPRESKRTRRYWSQVSKLERRVDEANNRLAQCLLKK